MKEIKLEDCVVLTERNPETITLEAAEIDSGLKKWIREQQVAGNDWAWCRVLVTLDWKAGLYRASTEIRTGCFLDYDDFKQSAKYKEQLEACLDMINSRCQLIVQLLQD